MWAGIKHALNSTLGTSNFKPLDKLIHNYIKTYINSTVDTNYFRPLDDLYQRRLVVSENLYTSLGNSNFADPGVTNYLATSHTFTFGYSVRFETSGTVKVVFTNEGNGISISSGNATVTIYAIINGAEKQIASSVISQNTRQFSVNNLNVNKGDTITFKLLINRTSGTGNVSGKFSDGKINIYADLVDQPMLVKQV